MYFPLKMIGSVLFPLSVSIILFEKFVTIIKAINTGSEVIKNFIFNSAEYEILNAHKYKKYQEIQLFSGSSKRRLLFFPAHNC